MIRTFSVSNFLSISDKQELNFITSNANSPLVAEMGDGTHLLKLGVLFGANAAGKSNILTALNEVFSLLVLPKTDINERIHGYLPFYNHNGEPTELNVSFYADGIRYDYSVKYNSSCVLNEELYYYPNRSKALFYERTFVDANQQANIKFGQSLHIQQKTQESIRENTLNNHSVLSVCKKNIFKEDIEPFLNLHSYVMEHYHEVDGDNKNDVVDVLVEAAENRKKYSFFCKMLKKADLNIEDFRVVDDLALGKKNVMFKNASGKDNFEIPLALQSKGTIKYIEILDALYDLISGEHIYYLDELGEDLHYDLLFYYLSVFIFNSGNSQLLITSQETTLLMQDIINDNRGAVWFVEKNLESASSEYNRGDSYKLHKNLSFYNSYKIGRLGAKPELGSFFLDLEEDINGKA